jgi:outer membrane lipoprotein-sorting protein
MDYTIQLGPKDRVTFKCKFIMLDPKDVFSTRYQCTWSQKGFKPLTIELKNILYFMPQMAYSS